MLTRLACTICGSSSMWRTRTPPSTEPTLAGSMSTMPATGKPALAEPAVAGERLAEVAGADDDDGPVVGEAELAADLVHEVRDLVADAAGAVAAEVADRSLRTLAALTPASSARRSLTRCSSTSSSACSVRMRRYTGSRATVASGMRRRGRSAGMTDHVRHSCTRSQSTTAVWHDDSRDTCSRVSRLVHRRQVATTVVAPMNVALAAAATLVAVAFALQHVRPLAAPAPPARAGVDDLAGAVRARVGALWWGEARGWSLDSVPGLLPRRRDPQRAVARRSARSTCSPASASGDRVRAWLVCSAGSRAGRRAGRPDSQGPVSRARVADGQGRVRCLPPRPRRGRVGRRRRS